MCEGNAALLGAGMIERLLRAAPEFVADPDDVSEGLAFLVYAALVIYASALSPSKDADLLRRIFAFLEAEACSKDKIVVDIVRDALAELSKHCDSAQYEKFFGKHVKLLLKEASSL